MTTGAPGRWRRALRIAAVAAVALAGTGQACASERLPGAMTWTAYDVASSGYAQSVAIGGALKRRIGVTLRVLPNKTAVARLAPLREKKAEFAVLGLSAFFSMEGVHEFAMRDWGPQPTRILLTSNADSNLAIGTARDAGIRTLADLKGKRIAHVGGSATLQENVAAMLAFAGLAWSDVTRVEFADFGAAWQGVVDGKADAAWSQTISGPAAQLEASPRGIHWPPVPHADVAGWARLRKVAPFFAPHIATLGAGLSKANPHEGATYPYPILTTYAGRSGGMVHAMTKAMVELFPDYRDAVPGADGWAIDRQTFDWVVPYHEGAVRYLLEAGVWTPAHQTHNDRLIARQTVLAEAWKGMEAQRSLADEAFAAAWVGVRAAALDRAGFDPYWR